MHREQIELWQHHHVFNNEKKAIEKRTFIVVIITFITMFAEILFGWLTNSMALFADGWHMGTHAFALGLSLFAYILARKYAQDDRFTFGAWKIEILGAYSSAIVLGIVGLFMISTSVERIINPLSIEYNQALFVAVVGFLVNVICAVILNKDGQSDEHLNDQYEHLDHHHNHYQDLNQKSAYLHVLADALTSVLAIVALLGAKYYNYNWLDPFMGVLGAVLILRWTVLLLKDTAKILLDREMDSPIAAEIKEEIESDGDTKISDLHVWQVAQNKYACIISLVMGGKYSIEEYKMRLKNIRELTHITIEIYQCNEGAA
jgi:cation diffusion facilitator family transporter